MKNGNEKGAFNCSDSTFRALVERENERMVMRFPKLCENCENEIRMKELQSVEEFLMNVGIILCECEVFLMQYVVCTCETPTGSKN